MAKVYVTRCAVKKDGKMYQKGSVIEGLTEAEINQGIEQHWLQKVGEKEETVKEEKPKGDKAKREKLLKKAEELKIAVTEEMSDEEIQKAIAEAVKKPEKTLEQMNKDELKAKAKELGIDVGLLDSEEKIRQKILEVKG
jgi:uncharacterized protein YaaW (UPF0174 family)